jgi:hypothetical protein
VRAPGVISARWSHLNKGYPVSQPPLRCATQRQAKNFQARELCEGRKNKKPGTAGLQQAFADPAYFASFAI